MNKIIFIIFTVLFFEGKVYSQEMWGVVNSNYAGINATLINPAYICDSKIWLDINLVTAGAFEGNNNFYLPKEEVGLFEIFASNPDFGEDPILKDNYDKKKNFKMNTNANLVYPSIMLNLGDRGFGLRVSSHAAASTRNADFKSTKFAYEGLDFVDQQNDYCEIRNKKDRALAWTEIAFTYSSLFHQVLDQHWAYGITLKKLQGNGGAYSNIPYANYIAYSDTSLGVEELNGDYSYALPLNYSDNSYVDDYGLSLGNGWGIDFGLSFQKKRDGNGLVKYDRACEQKWGSYIFKVGVSLLDLGWIKFKDNVYSHSFDKSKTYWNGIDKYSPGSIGQLSADVDSMFTSVESGESDKIYMGLPTALALQFDIHPAGYWFFNFSYIQPLPIFKNSVYRPTLICFAPRFEKRLFEVSFPISLYEWTRPSVGLALRYRGLTLGTDHLTSMTGLFDVYGSDVYLSWKFSFVKGQCRRRASFYHRGNRFYNKACPIF